MEFNKFLTYKYILLKITYYTFMNLGEKKNIWLYRAELAEKDNQSWITLFTFQWRRTQIESGRDY